VSSGADAHKTVLIVDDVPLVRSAITDVLEHAGYTVVCAQDAAQGLRLARERSPAVILLDLALPKKSGLDLLDELKASHETRGIPVILVSAYAHLLSGSDARSAASVIQKPFNVTDLLTQVERALSMQREHGSLAEPGA
jgi:DNA-binding response OmpR family regulator